MVLEISELIWKQVNFVRSRAKIWSFMSLSSVQNVPSRPHDTDLTEAQMTPAAPRDRPTCVPLAAGCQGCWESQFFIHKSCMSERIALGRLRARRETVSATHFILNNFPRKFPMFLSMWN